jgi:hypothetical protein
MFTPGRLLLLIIGLLVIVLLAIPAPDERNQGAALSMRSATPRGARGLHDVLRRLGFPVEQRLLPMRQGLDTQAVFVVLDPPMPLTTTEIHRLLQTVRAGASLLALPSPAGQLADSLGVAREQEAVARAADERRRVTDVNSAVLERRWLRHVLRKHTHPPDTTRVYRPPAGALTFDSVRTERGTEPIIVGFPLGRGRVVVAAEPDLFSNFVFREGNAAVRVVRLLEWLQAGNAKRPIIFDEYHHGFGSHANTRVVTTRALTRTGAGRTVLQLAAAGLLLLFALGVRPVKPRARTRIERRSALEHVGALARAYATVRAHARATRLLVRGLRRRHGGLRGPRDEVAYLKALAEHNPEVSGAVQLLANTMEGRPAAPDGEAVTAAILRIERAITS